MFPVFVIICQFCVMVNDKNKEFNLNLLFSDYKEVVEAYYEETKESPPEHKDDPRQGVLLNNPQFCHDRILDGR